MAFEIRHGFALIVHLYKAICFRQVQADPASRQIAAISSMDVIRQSSVRTVLTGRTSHRHARQMSQSSMLVSSEDPQAESPPQNGSLNPFRPCTFTLLKLLVQQLAVRVGCERPLFSRHGRVVLVPGSPTSRSYSDSVGRLGLELEIRP